MSVICTVLEADYTVGLQLLLKYPAPKHPHESYSLVGDACYLSNHLTPSAGSAVILKYTGKAPLNTARIRPLLPPTMHSGAKTLLRTHALFMSPLRNRAHPFGQQDGVKALVPGAAKNVLRQGEKLGIKQALRDAVGDIRRGWSDAKNQAITPGAGAAPAPAPEAEAKDALVPLEQRNGQLVLMLDEAFNDLKALSAAENGYREAIEMVAAKVHAVKVHLEGSTLVVGDDMSEPKTKETAVAHAPVTLTVKTGTSPVMSKSDVLKTSPARPPSRVPALNLGKLASGISTMAVDKPPQTKPQSPAPAVAGTETSRKEHVQELQHGQSSPASTGGGALAQGKFAYMLEGPEMDMHEGTGPSRSPRASSWCIAHTRPGSVDVIAARERNAFLFGGLETHVSQVGGFVGKPEGIFNISPINKDTKGSRRVW